MPFGIVKSSEVRKNRDGNANVRMLTVEISDPDDLQSVELITQTGEDYNPLVGSRVVIEELGDAFKVAIASDDGIVPTAPVGERWLYAIDSGGSVTAIIKIKVDGTLEYNGGGGTAVEFARLKTAFDQLKSDFDDLVTAHNDHIHITTAVVGGGGAAGVIAPTTTTGAATTSDIDPAESDTVTLP